MPHDIQSPSALAGLRVLDLSTNYAAYAGRLLADLGADVVRVEPPEGSPVRRLGPSQSLPNGETFSFAQAFLDANKRSVTLDLEDPEGAAAFGRLLASSDIVIVTPGDGEPGAIARLVAAAKEKPGLIVASITPYGIGGPYAHRRATDLTTLASGGLLSFGGYADSEPIGIQGEQACLASAIFAVVGILAALVEREATGKGQCIDVSAQECVAFALEDAVPDWYINHKIRRRNGDRAREAGTGIYPCQDGYISMVAGRLGTATAFVRLTEWIADSGSPDGEQLLEPQWRDFKYRQSAEGIARFADIFGKFAAIRSKEELYREGQKRQIAIAPVNSIADVAANLQLASSGYFKLCAQPALGRDLAFPGAPYHLARTPARPPKRAPALGEHNRDILHSDRSSVEAAPTMPASN